MWFLVCLVLGVLVPGCPHRAPTEAGRGRVEVVAPQTPPSSAAELVLRRCVHLPESVVGAASELLGRRLSFSAGTAGRRGSCDGHLRPDAAHTDPTRRVGRCQVFPRVVQGHPERLRTPTAGCPRRGGRAAGSDRPSEPLFQKPRRPPCRPGTFPTHALSGLELVSSDRRGGSPSVSRDSTWRQNVHTSQLSWACDGVGV